MFAGRHNWIGGGGIIDASTNDLAGEVAGVTMTSKGAGGRARGAGGRAGGGAGGLGG